MHLQRLAATMMVLATAACSPKAPPVQAEPVGECTGSTDTMKHVTIGPSKLQGAVLGKGSVGLVLAHQNQGSACQWLPNAMEFAQQGYRVLIFSFSGFGGS